MRERLQEMTAIAQSNLAKAQRRQKRYYDEKARPQDLEVGDKVLVFVPTKHSKLEWAGPYKITKQVTPVDFEVEMPGRRKSRRIYHVNLLKKWHTPANSHSLLVVLQEMPPGKEDIAEEGELENYLLPADGPQEVTVNSLEATQQLDLKQLLQEFPDVSGEKLGRTSVVQHEMEVGDSSPIRQQAYRLPEA